MVVSSRMPDRITEDNDVIMSAPKNMDAIASADAVSILCTYGLIMGAARG